MRSSRPATFFAILLTLIFSFSTGCFAFPAASVEQVSQAQGGCHGHHGPMPDPSPLHTCCFAAHQVPAATSISAAPASLDATADHAISTLSIGEPDPAITTAAEMLNASPPLIAVLRI
jgi:hypothetical protein